MFDVKIGNDTYTVWIDRNKSGHTQVEIKGKDDNIIATGVATCHNNDQYNKSYGRKLAFARALESIKNYISRANRAIFWDAYKKHHRITNSRLQVVKIVVKKDGSYVVEKCPKGVKVYINQE